MNYRSYVAKQLEGVTQIGSEQYDQLLQYLNEMLRWNKKINLTSIVDEGECWEKHIVDSLLVAGMLSGDEHVLDIGSGAGLPSIPLKICFSDLDVVSVDSVAKKIRFQRHVGRLLNFDRFDARSARIEQLESEFDARFDVVTSRAFASLELFVRHALPFVGNHGRIIALKSTGVDREIAQAERFFEAENLYIHDNKTYQLLPSNSKRVLLDIRRKN